MSCRPARPGSCASRRTASSAAAERPLSTTRIRGKREHQGGNDGDNWKTADDNGGNRGGGGAGAVRGRDGGSGGERGGGVRPGKQARPHPRLQRPGLGLRQAQPPAPAPFTPPKRTRPPKLH